MGGREAKPLHLPFPSSPPSPHNFFYWMCMHIAGRQRIASFVGRNGLCCTCMALTVHKFTTEYGRVQWHILLFIDRMWLEHLPPVERIGQSEMPNFLPPLSSYNVGPAAM